MGNTNTGNTSGGGGGGDGRGSSTKSRNSDRPYSIDLYGSLERRSDSPRADDTRFDFASSVPGKRRPVLCYQSSTDYGNDDTIEDFKVGGSFVPRYHKVLICCCPQLESPQQFESWNQRNQ